MVPWQDAPRHASKIALLPRNRPELETMVNDSWKTDMHTTDDDKSDHDSQEVNYSTKRTCHHFCGHKDKETSNHPIETAMDFYLSKIVLPELQI